VQTNYFSGNLFAEVSPVRRHSKYPSRAFSLIKRTNLLIILRIRAILLCLFAPLFCSAPRNSCGGILRNRPGSPVSREENFIANAVIIERFAEPSRVCNLDRLINQGYKVSVFAFNKHYGSTAVALPQDTRNVGSIRIARYSKHGKYLYKYSKVGLLRNAFRAEGPDCMNSLLVGPFRGTLRDCRDTTGWIFWIGTELESLFLITRMCAVSFGTKSVCKMYWRE
jgi:hypothetical protein